MYKVNFKVSLYPEDTTDINNEETFQKYLCNDYESEFVITHLYTVHKNNSIAHSMILNLEYTANGSFTCEITGLFINKDNKNRLIKQILWPYQIDNKYLIYIDEGFYNVHLKIESIELVCYSNICEFCDENDVEHTCTDCETKICYPCRDKCSNCMETLCPNCFTDGELCSGCLD